MTTLEKLQTPLLFISIIVGILLGKIKFIEQTAENFIIPCLFLMLFGVFFNIPLNSFQKKFLNLKFSLVTIIINFIWTPILVILLGKFFLPNNPILQLGLLMLMVTPCTDWYLVFTGIVSGNVPLSTTVLPINLLLQILLLPAYLYLASGIIITIDINELLKSIVFMLLIPFFIARIFKVILRKITLKETQEKASNLLSSLQTLLLMFVIISMFASKSKTLIANLNIITMLILPIIFFYIINFILSQRVGKILKYSYADTASLTLTTIAKNSPMTLGVALMAFPNEPIIHLIMIIEPLIELPFMFFITRVLILLKNKVNVQYPHN